MSCAQTDVMGQMSSDPPTLPIMVSAKVLPGLAATSHYFSPVPCPPHGVTPCILDHALKIISLCLCLCPKAQNSWSPSSIKAWDNHDPPCWFPPAQPLTSIPAPPVSCSHTTLVTPDQGYVSVSVSPISWAVFQL